MLAVGVLVLGVAAAYVVAMWPFRPSEIVLPKPTFLRLTDDRGIESWPSLSPDSREIVYAARRPTGEAGIYLSSIAGGLAVQLSKEASDDTPAFSPDGRSIAFSSARDKSPGIFVMDRRGESVRRLTSGTGL